MVRPVWQDKKVSARLKKNELGDLRGESFNQWIRHFLLFRRKVAGRHMGAMLRLKNDELRWLIASIVGDEEPLDEDQREGILANIHQRQTQANLSRTHRMSLPNPDGRGAQDDGKNPKRGATHPGDR